MSYLLVEFLIYYDTKPKSQTLPYTVMEKFIPPNNSISRLISCKKWRNFGFYPLIIIQRTYQHYTIMALVY